MHFLKEEKKAYSGLLDSFEGYMCVVGPIIGVSGELGDYLWVNDCIFD